jgi:hypothetical protein
MAVSAAWYGQAEMKALNKEIDYDTDVIKIMLLTNAYTLNQDTHVYKSDLTNEVAGTGYTAGGATLASKAITYTGATNVVMLDADDPDWPNSTIVARYAIIYDSSPATDATRPLLGYIDFGQDRQSDGGAFHITFAAAGFLTATAA